MSDQSAYPLSWPENWPRTKFRRCSPFNRKRSMENAKEFLLRELRMLGATKAVLSTNIRLRVDGFPYSGQAQPPDPGAAVYFELKKKAVSMACDKWDRVEDNIYAISKHIEALRGQERWGVGSIDQAFRGYMALPAVGESSASQWWKVLGVPINASPEQVREAYRLLVKKHHPDLGGDAELFRRLTQAMEQFDLGQRGHVKQQQQQEAA